MGEGIGSSFGNARRESAASVNEGIKESRMEREGVYHEDWDVDVLDFIEKTTPIMDDVWHNTDDMMLRISNYNKGLEDHEKIALSRKMSTHYGREIVVPMINGKIQESINDRFGSSYLSRYDVFRQANELDMINRNVRSAIDYLNGDFEGGEPYRWIMNNGVKAPLTKDEFDVMSKYYDIESEAVPAPTKNEYTRIINLLG